MVEPYMLGFYELHGIGDYRFATISNYSKVGFGFDVGNQLVPLMHPSFRGTPNLGLDHDGLVISIFLLEFCIGSAQGKMEATSRLGR